MAKLQYLIIHCTATAEGKSVSSSDIRSWHTSPKSKGGRGWKQVGYADMIHLNGGVENLVPYNDDNTVDPWEITNGATGTNDCARHIVYVGGVDANGKPKDTRTKEQKDAMRRYVIAFASKNPDAQIVGHCHFANKACPSFDVQAWLKTLNIGK